MSFQKFWLSLALFFVLQTGTPLAAQDHHPVADALSSKFGQVMVKDLEGSYEFTVSADFADVLSILETSNTNECYVSFVSISRRNDGKAAIIFRGSNQRNNSSQLFSKLQQLIQPGVLFWKKDAVPEDSAVVTGIETSFNSKIMINGVTRKSSLIFSQLFPMIERVNLIKNPFFSRGTYSDTEDGRVMNFIIDCDW